MASISHLKSVKPFGAFSAGWFQKPSFLRTILPGVGGSLYGAACTYDNTRMKTLSLIRCRHDNVLLITGLKAAGFKFASVLGRIAAQFAGIASPV